MPGACCFKKLRMLNPTLLIFAGYRFSAFFGKDQHHASMETK